MTNGINGTSPTETDFSFCRTILCTRSRVRIPLTVVAVDHQIKGRRVVFFQQRRDFVQRRRRRDRQEMAVHQFAGPLQKMSVRLQRIRHVVAAAGEFECVNALRADDFADAVTDGHRNRHRNDHPVIQGHFKYHDDRRHRGARRSADHSGHSRDGKRGRADGHSGKQSLEQDAVRAAEGGSQKQGRREDSAGRARTERERRRQELKCQEQQQESPARFRARKNVLNRRVADSLDVIVPEAGHEGVHDRSDSEHASHVLHVVSAFHLSA